jgi:uncharacterized SAM-binding protein YcdF (DUF218 family)
VTQLVEFVFSGAGVITIATVTLLWMQIRGRLSPTQRIGLVAVGAYALVAIHPLSHAVSSLFTRGQRPFVAADASGRVVVVILGSGSYVAEDWDGHSVTLPNQTGMERAVEAARVYRLVKPEGVIASGGRVHAEDPRSASAEGSRRLLVELGVPPSKILLENTARTTHDESVAIAAMLKALAADRVVVVTSDLHMPRALGAFRAQGIAAVPAVARRPYDRPPWNLDVLPSDAGLEEAGAVARETLGIVYYAMRGWYRFP